MMKRRAKFNIALVAVVCLLCVALCGSALADETGERAAELTETPVLLDGLLSMRGYVIGDVTYLSLDSTCALLGYQSQTQGSSDDTVTVFIENITISFDRTEKYMTANGRCFYLPDGYVEIAGSPAVPIEIAAKLFSLSLSVNPVYGAYDLGTENEALLAPAGAYYNEEDLYWLSRLITYESGNQPFEGQIGVGNVVMNRVASDKFPDTVKKVIFQQGQFAPVERKAIFLDPYESGVVAAKIALEGCKTVGDALYFHTGDYGSDIAERNKDFVTKIGGHNFFVSIEKLKGM